MIARTLSHYRIVEKLGQGGMGVVCKAQNLHLDRLVTVKVLQQDKLADSRRKRNFAMRLRLPLAESHSLMQCLH